MPSIAPEVIFHDVDRSQWVEDYIAERLEKLERFAQGITRCHVTLSQEQGKHKKGNRYSLMVQVRIPPQPYGLVENTEVRFSPEQGEDGLQASSVQVIGKPASI